MKIEYRNASGLLCVIGDPIAHSLSPLLQNAMLEALGEDYVYLAVKVPGGNVKAFVSAAKTMGIGGFNLTMPHKEDILPYLSDMTAEAAACNSVNSVRIRDGKLEGHSTDGLGFRRSIQSLGWDFPGQVVTLLGAGGAAKSVAMTAVAAEAKEIRVVNRTLSRAKRLCQGHEVMRAYPMEQISDLLPDTDILVNCTSMGMEGAGAGSIPSLKNLKPEALCMDCIYAPPVTPFMEEARRWGHTAENGLGMLIYQAIYALAFFLNKEFDEETVGRLARRLMSVQEKERNKG